MAQRCGLTQARIDRIWRGFRLQPHRVEGLKLAKDPLFIDKVHDTVGLYLDPPPMLTFVVYLDEHWFAALTEKQLRRRVHRTTGETPEYHPLLIWNSKATRLSLRVDANR